MIKGKCVVLCRSSNSDALKAGMKFKAQEWFKQNRAKTMEKLLSSQEPIGVELPCLNYISVAAFFVADYEDGRVKIIRSDDCMTGIRQTGSFTNIESHQHTDWQELL